VTVTFTATGGTGTLSATTCVLAGTTNPTCSVNYTPSAPGTTSISASYPGNSTTLSSTGNSVSLVATSSSF
jgi:hypothetical protein